jgi:hypothetical protein
MASCWLLGWAPLGSSAWDAPGAAPASIPGRPAASAGGRRGAGGNGAGATALGMGWAGRSSGRSWLKDVGIACGRASAAGSVVRTWAAGAAGAGAGPAAWSCAGPAGEADCSSPVNRVNGAPVARPEAGAAWPCGAFRSSGARAAPPGRVTVDRGAAKGLAGGRPCSAGRLAPRASGAGVAPAAAAEGGVGGGSDGRGAALASGAAAGWVGTRDAGTAGRVLWGRS